MADMAPMKAYQGSSGMRRYEASSSDKRSDARGKAKEGSRREEARDRREARKTIVGAHKGSRVSK